MPVPRVNTISRRFKMKAFNDALSKDMLSSITAGLVAKEDLNIPEHVPTSKELQEAARRRALAILTSKSVDTAEVALLQTILGETSWLK